MLLEGDVRQLSLEGMEKLDPTLFVFVGGLEFAQMYSQRRKCVFLGSGQFSYTRVSVGLAHSIRHQRFLVLVEKKWKGFMIHTGE